MWSRTAGAVRQPRLVTTSSRAIAIVTASGQARRRYPPIAREGVWRVVDSSSAAAASADDFRPESGPDAVTITAEDLVAVTMLGVQVPAAVCVDLLHGSLGEAIASSLVTIPVDVALEDAEAELVRAGSPADRAWHVLTEQHGVSAERLGEVGARLEQGGRRERGELGAPPGSPVARLMELLQREHRDWSRATARPSALGPA